MVKIDTISARYQSSIIVFFSICSTGLTLFIYAMSARNYDVKSLSMGILVLSISWYLVNVIDFGLSTFAVQEVLSERRRVEDFYTIGILKILCFVGFSATLGMVFNFEFRYLFYGSIITLSLLIIQHINIGLRVEGRTSIPGLFALIEKLSTSFILTLNFNLDWRLQFLEVYMYGVVVSLIVALKFRQIRLGRINLLEIFSVSMKSLPLGFSSLIGQAKLLDVNFLALMIGTVASAPYILVSRWASSINLFSNAFSQSILPFFSKGKLSKSAFVEAKNAAFWLILALAFSLIICLASPLIIEFILGEESSESVIILRVLSLATIFSILIQPLTVFVQTQSRASFVTLSLLSGFVAQVLIIFFLSDSIGAISAAIGYFCGQFICFCLLVIFALPLKENFIAIQ